MGWEVRALASRGRSSGTGAHGPEGEEAEEEENVLPILKAGVARVVLLGRTQRASTRKILAK